jgi:hypothetical protein
MITAKQLANLRPLKKGDPRRCNHSPGRPRKKAWVEELDALASSGKEFLPFLRRLLHKKPEIAAYYLAGKPLEQMRLEAEITTGVSQKTIDGAAAAFIKLMDEPKSPVSQPSEENKTALKQS